MQTIHGSIEVSVGSSESPGTGPVSASISRFAGLALTPSVLTGTDDAGTDGDVRIQFIGSLAESKEITLDNPFTDDFRTGKTSSFQLAGPLCAEIQKIGDIQGVRVWCGTQYECNFIPKTPDDLYIREIKVTINDALVSKIPCYGWILYNYTRPQFFFAAGASLPSSSSLSLHMTGDGLSYNQQQHKPTIDSIRSLELEHIRTFIRFSPFISESCIRVLAQNIDHAIPYGPIPSGYTTIPRTDRFSQSKSDLFGKSLIEGSIRTILPPVFSKKQANGLSECWMKDEEFVRQLLQGTNPVIIQRCTGLPDWFNLHAFEKTIPKFYRYYTLNTAINDGLVFMLDYGILEPFVGSHTPDPAEKTRVTYVRAPVCLLLYTNGTLIPICIQLDRKSDAHVYVPGASVWLWRIAKLHVQAADSLAHQIITHFVGTHLCMEPVAIATRRQLSANHPIHRLLYSHLHTVIGINAIARDGLFSGETGVSIKLLGLPFNLQCNLIKNVHENWKLCSFPRRLCDRGVSSRELKLDYPWRDDGLLVYSAIFRFVESYCRHWYPRSEAIALDVELQGWFTELGPNVMTPPINTVSIHTLIETVTNIIWTCSAEHASLNFSQAEYYGFVPNRPMAVYLPPPDDVCETEEFYMEVFTKSLPPTGTAALQEIMVRTLSVYELNEQSLYMANDNNYLDGSIYFHSNSPIADMYTQFRNQLRSIELEIGRRNKIRKTPYIRMLPSKITSSITI